MKKLSENKTIDMLLSGKHAKAKKYAGHHVLVIGNKITPLKEGQGAIEDIDFLEKKYEKTPTLVFVPRQDVYNFLYASFL